MQEAKLAPGWEQKLPKLEFAWASDIGRRRAKNQDSAGSFPDLGLFVVADGMGGHRGGEVASQLAVQTLSERYKAGRSTFTPEQIKDLIFMSASKANEAILLRSKQEKELEGMGTTTTLITFHQKRALIGHIGDSRCYLIRNDGIWQLTRDHSLVYEKLRAGLITREQMKTDKMKNVITRSVGFEFNFQVEFFEYEPKPGDLFLICSDGLTGQLEDIEIFQMANKILFQTPNIDDVTRKSLLSQLVETLIQNANDRGGDDNITVLLVQYLQAGA